MEGLVKLEFHFAIPQGTLPWQPIKFSKSAFFADQSLLSRFHSKTDCKDRNLDFKKLNGINISALCRILMRFSPLTPEFTLLEIYDFFRDTEKIGILRQIYWNILDRLLLSLQIW